LWIIELSRLAWCRAAAPATFENNKNTVIK